MTENTDSIPAEKTAAPPYISFRTLLNLIERMANEGVPPRIDRSYLAGLSGGYQTQVMAALRWLGLTSDGGSVTTSLTELVDNPEQRAELIGKLLWEKYPEAARLGEENATQGQLEDEFKRYDISGATLRKCVAFYLHAARFAGIPVSPFFKAPSTSSEAGSTRRRRTRSAPSGGSASSTTAPSAPATTEAELRTRYIDMLMKKAESQEDFDADLLDRIETLLGFGPGRDEDEPED